MMRHLVCVDAKTGKSIWQKELKPTKSEDYYSGMGVPEHGYATSTPATDGKAIYVFLAKSGMAAFDLKGKKLWQTSVGSSSSRKRWGSSSSPIIHGDLVFINALQEGHKIFALNKADGKIAWQWGPDAYSSYQDTYGTPSLVKAKDKTELVLAVPGEIWSFDAKKGNITWYAYTNVGGRGGNVSPSTITGGDALYVFGGRPGSGVAVKLGGKGEVKESSQLWTSRSSPYVATPVYHEGHLYWMDRSGYAVCLNASTGREAFRERLKSNGRSTPKFYSSPVVVDGKIISVSRNAGAFVLEAKPKFKQLGQNTFASDRSVFNASPAVSNGRLFLRSDTHLYCVAGE